MPNDRPSGGFRPGDPALRKQPRRRVGFVAAIDGPQRLPAAAAEVAAVRLGNRGSGRGGGSGAPNAQDAVGAGLVEAGDPVHLGQQQMICGQPPCWFSVGA